MLPAHPLHRIAKLTTSLVIQVPPTGAPSLIKNGSLLFNRIHPVKAVRPATQCTLCWQFGHPAAGCPKGHSNAQCCRICGDQSHTARAHPSRLPSQLTTCFPRVFCLVSLQCGSRSGLAVCLVKRFLDATTTGCMRPFVPRTKNEITAPLR